MPMVGAAAPLVLGLVCSYAPVCADEIRIDTPQRATLIFTTGRQFRGELLSLNSKEVRFKIGRGWAPITYKAEQFKEVRAATDTYIYSPDKKIFESAKALAAPTVIAEGVGLTAAEAREDACRNAVRQVVGVVVQAETLVQDDEVVSDKVFASSNGLVKEYEEISKKQKDGLVLVKISAVVQRPGAEGESSRVGNPRVGQQADQQALVCQAPDAGPAPRVLALTRTEITYLTPPTLGYRSYAPRWCVGYGIGVNYQRQITLSQMQGGSPFGTIRKR
jgi:hypothetical protein